LAEALQIHRRAIVVDTHNDITTAMTNDDYDLGGTPPAPYRTSIERMKQGGQTAEFFRFTSALVRRAWRRGPAHARHDRCGLSRG